MKKILLLILLFVLISPESNARDYSVTATYGKNFLSGGSVDMLGINLEIFLTDNLSINYSASFGNNKHGLFYHTTGGLVSGLYLLINSPDALNGSNENDESSSGFIYGSSVFLMILPEGINYYIPLSQYITLGAYCNPFGYDYFDTGNSLTSAVGVKLVYHLSEHLILVPQMGINIIYAHENPAVLNLGLSVGFKL
jgi:hypothetical protein